MSSAVSNVVSITRQRYRPQEVAFLYNPAPVAAEADYSGDTYVVPACNVDNGFGPGVLKIEGKPANPAPQDHLRGQAGYRNEPIRPFDIVEHLVGGDGQSGKLGKRGVREVYNAPEDEQIRAEAQKAYAEFQYSNDLTIQNEYLKAKESAKDAGLPIPQPDKRTRDAMLRIKRAETESGVAPKFTCPDSDCGWGFPTEDDLRAHAEVMHSGARPVAEKASEVADLKAEVAELKDLVRQLATKRKGGRPKKEKPVA